MAFTYTIRKDGRLMKRVSVNGKLKTLYSDSPKDLEDQYIEAKYLSKKGMISDNESLTLEQWANQWIEIYKSDKSDNTYKMYKEAINIYITPYLGKYKLKSLKQKDVLNLLNIMTKKGITRRKDIVLMTIKQILDNAVENDYISKNVSKGIKIKKHKSAEKEPLTDNLIDEIKKLASDNPRAFMILFMIYTGLRKQEVIPLQYKDIDLNNKYISVNKAVELIHNQPVIKKTKNEDNRKVPILNVIYDKLVEMKSDHSDNDYVFPNTLNKMMSDTTMKRQIQYVINDLNKILDYEVYFTYHQLRHTYACILHKAGVDLKEAQSFTGHKTLQILLDVYTHLDERDKQNAVNKLNNFLSN
ncbi:MAG: site-specific integrase [Clostridia bacterium]|nr:site-specific integrase [Clostridia bacterium]